MPRWKQNTRKLRELILFIAEQSADDQVGDIYLNKVLFFSDALALQRLGKPITGAIPTAADGAGGARAPARPRGNGQGWRCKSRDARHAARDRARTRGGSGCVFIR